MTIFELIAWYGGFAAFLYGALWIEKAVKKNKKRRFDLETERINRTRDRMLAEERMST
ncbi:hypothetical protein [Variovorax sp. RO1]|uniref:hypothetical protein n=1 Tax=Variovorax sp. RO1 TaxID=2066034 RepID=UPI0015DEE1BA|nr:hypothetical protein [Variovorax sp. RO1]